MVYRMWRSKAGADGAVIEQEPHTACQLRIITWPYPPNIIFNKVATYKIGQYGECNYKKDPKKFIFVGIGQYKYNKKQV